MQFLFDLLNSNDSTQKYAAEEILSELDKPLTTLFLTLLKETLHDDRWEIRCTALKLFSQYLHNADDVCFPDVSELIFDPIEEVRLAAIDYGHISNTALIDALADSSYRVRRAAHESLTKRGGLDPGDCFHLAEYLSRGDSGLREMTRDLLLSNGQEQLLRQFTMTE